MDMFSKPVLLYVIIRLGRFSASLSYWHYATPTHVPIITNYTWNSDFSTPWQLSRTSVKVV